MNPIIWVAIACFGGALLGYISKWLSGGIANLKAFVNSLLTGVIAAAVFAGAYQLNGGSLTVLDVLGALVAGWGTVTGVQLMSYNYNMKKYGTPYRNKMNQPK
jgi:hypothetical protein